MSGDAAPARAYVNNAAVAMYGRLTALPLEDMRRQFDVNYWGQGHGCLTAIPHLRATVAR